MINIVDKYKEMAGLKKNEWSAFIINFVICSIYCWYLFRTLLSNLGHSLFGGGGDGAKNYYTYLYHVENGKGFHFEGMNYPWGDKVIFSDNQPLLAVPLSYLHISIHQAIWIMNFILIFNFIVSGIMLTRFFLKNNTPWFLAGIFPILIIFMAPNFYRIFGHYGLSYLFNFIWMLILIFQFHKQKKIQYLVGIFLINVAMAFIHMYNLLLGFILILLYYLSYLILEKETFLKKIKTLAAPLTTALLSFVSVKIIFLLTDHITDRPSSPWGIMYYVAEFKNFFLSDYSPFGKIYSLIFNGATMGNLDESYVYIGFIPSLYILFILFNAIAFFYKKGKNEMYLPLLSTERYLILFAFFSSLLAMGYPFISGMDWLLDYMPALKQFRSLGRIGLITYLSLHIACVLRISVMLNFFLEKKHYRLFLYILLPIVSFWTLEIFYYSKYSQKRADEGVDHYLNIFLNANIDDKGNLIIAKDTNFQAIIGLPFFNIGSEKIGAEAKGNFPASVYGYSLLHSLPIVDVMMSRTSWKQAFQQSRLMGGCFTDKEYFTSSLRSKKDFVIFHQKDALLTEGEHYLIENSDTISQNDRFITYRLNWDQLISNEKQTIDSLNKIQIDKFQNINLPIFLNTFDSHSSNNSFFGTASATVSELDSLLVLNESISINENVKYEFSIWALIDSTSFFTPFLKVLLYDENHQQISESPMNTKAATDNRNFWFRISSEIEIPNNTKKIEIIFYNPDQR
ncbi:MAG: hypothetical protein IT215_04465, partial [Chitinophagaceae bacterium]|nr:hypothetical protein [Chitinophagaceae bacterium]